MKLTITMPESTHNLLMEYIERRFGPGSARVKSAVIRAAVIHYIYPAFEPKTEPTQETKPLEQ